MKTYILILSDIHLGSSVLNVNKLLWVLDNIKFSRLIINGDLFDDLNFHRLNKEHWKILSKIRKISKNKEVIFTEGNHDTNVETLIHLIGAEYYKDYVFYINDKKFLITHGDLFDGFICNFPFLTWFFTGLYYIIQKLSRKNQLIPRFLKYLSKRVLGVHKKLRNKAIKFGVNHSAQVIICGHSHFADEFKNDKIEYFNSGTFCEKTCSFVTIDNKGNCKLEEI